MYLDFDKIAGDDQYKMLISTVLPRPIALVTTMNAERRVNAAPFSFFNAVSGNPPVIAIGINERASGGNKDTLENVRHTGEFVVNLVTNAIAEPMNICAVDFPPGVNELDEAKLTPAPANKVSPPRIAESPVSMECTLHTLIGLGNEQYAALGNVVAMHLRDDLLDVDKMYVAADALDVIGRMHGRGWYARTTDLFEMPRITLEEWGSAGPRAPEHPAL